MTPAQLPLDHIEPLPRSVPGPYVTYPHILSFSLPTVHSCILQEIRDYRTNGLVGRFVYLSHRSTHKQLLSGWKRRLRSAGIALSESRHARRTSKELCLQEHRGREITATSRATAWYRRIAIQKLRFKKPERTECLEVTVLLGARHTPFLGQAICVFIPSIDTLLVIDTKYQTNAAQIGFVGTRRRRLLEQVQRMCTNYWRTYSTYDLFP